MKKLNVYFACDAGMGSSALGASVLKRLVDDNVNVSNCSVYEIPYHCDVIVVQRGLLGHIQDKDKYKKVFAIDYFLDEKQLQKISKEIMQMVENSKILTTDLIVLNCESCTSDEAIIAVGKLLQDNGYIEEAYIEGMLKRDHELTTYIGNDLAIPHGEYDVKDYVIKTGMAVMVYPDGIDWNGNKARIVIGIAANGNDHMAILSNIALTLSDMSAVEDIVASKDKNYIYEVLTKGA